MSKRPSASGSLSLKKPRVEDLGDSWDDDFDCDAIDDCFERATQAIKEREKDVTLLSSYSVFKPKNEIYTSTQCSQAPDVNNDIVQSQIKELQVKYAEKEGEASILRSTLQNLRTSCYMDQEKKQNEWKEKLSLLEKDNKAVKSELEFKNLEIANLKQQIAEIVRLRNNEQSFTQKQQCIDNKSSCSTSPKKSTEPEVKECSRIYINIEKYYPLRSFNRVFKARASRDENIIELNASSSKIHHTQDIVNHLKELDICSMYEELLFFVSLSSEELNSDKYYPRINKVLWLSFGLLKKFHDCLIELSSQTDEELEVPSVQMYRLQEISFVSCEVLEFLNEMLPFNTFLKNCLLEDNSMAANKQNYQERLVNNLMKEGETPEYLILLSNIIASIGQTKKEKEFAKFLSTVMKLLCKLFSSEDLTNSRQNMVKNIAKHLLFLNLSCDLVSEVLLLLNIITRNPDMLDAMCTKYEDSKEDCRLQKCIVLLEEASTKDLFSKISSDVLNLTYNVFRFQNKSINQEDNKLCTCVSELYKLAISIIYKNTALDKTCPTKWVKNHIKILSLLLFNAYDLTQKYVTDFARYKEIIYSLTHIYNEADNVNLKNLEKMSAAEDFPVVPKEAFLGVEL